MLFPSSLHCAFVFIIGFVMLVGINGSTIEMCRNGAYMQCNSQNLPSFNEFESCWTQHVISCYGNFVRNNEQCVVVPINMTENLCYIDADGKETCAEIYYTIYECQQN